jgi:hypothetical protein
MSTLFLDQFINTNKVSPTGEKRYKRQASIIEAEKKKKTIMNA